MAALNNRYARQNGAAVDTPRHKTQKASAFASIHEPHKKSIWGEQSTTADGNQGEITEHHSGFNMKNRLVCSLTVDSILKQLAIGFIRLGDANHQAGRLSVGDDFQGAYNWATMAVVTSKSETKSSSAGNKYVMLRVSDLDRTNTGVFLFGQAYDTHMQLDRGAIIMLLAPKLMDAKEGYETRALSIRNEDQLRRIGTSTELTFCPAKKRANGEACGSAVSKRRGGYCQYHLKQAYHEMNASRLDVTGGLLNVAPRGGGAAAFKATTRASNFDTTKMNQYRPISTTGLLATSLQGAKQVVGLAQQRMEEVSMHRRMHTPNTSKGAPATVAKPPPITPCHNPQSSLPSRVQAQIQQLEDQMKKCAADMNFERAAQLRDRIQAPPYQALHCKPS